MEVYTAQNRGRDKGMEDKVEIKDYTDEEMILWLNQQKSDLISNKDILAGFLTSGYIKMSQFVRILPQIQD
jgi:hypothetical protein